MSRAAWAVLSQRAGSLGSCAVGSASVIEALLRDEDLRFAVVVSKLMSPVGLSLLIVLSSSTL